MKTFRFSLAVIAVIGYALISMFGLLAVQYMHSHSMSNIGEHCPFMIDQNTICTMNTDEHINAWKNFVLATFIKFISICIPLSLIYFFIFVHPPDLISKTRKEIPAFQSFITILFSRGILNSKVF